MSAKEYKQFKGLRKENLRDNMDNIELILTDLSEETIYLDHLLRLGYKYEFYKINTSIKKRQYKKPLL